jgi:hypothetical protein
MDFFILIQFFFFYYIHMCIQCLGHFSPLSSRPPPNYQAETILPLPLAFLKKEYKQ